MIENFTKPSIKNNMLIAQRTPAMPSFKDISSDAIGWFISNFIAFRTWITAKLKNTRYTNTIPYAGLYNLRFFENNNLKTIMNATPIMDEKPAINSPIVSCSIGISFHSLKYLRLNLTHCTKIPLI
ncbi:hypothetical protein [Lysinibacillus telephonicus]|uniref:hypothetical protein n=1 Tax=Lysinibacillus telephonicus TaxID=1714840 RepID=UPI001639A060|nr:hypothetical protein [Lysinibacillus telephonicus]